MRVHRPKLEVWPADKPIPRFKNFAEEDRFWTTHEFEDEKLHWERVDGPATKFRPVTATGKPRGGRST
jgi:hypothetical protein